MGKTILSRDITHEEVQALLTQKRTPLLSGFISKRNQRAFKAYLVLKSNGSVAFEFEERKAEAKADAKTAETKTAEAAAEAPAKKRPGRRKKTAE